MKGIFRPAMVAALLLWSAGAAWGGPHLVWDPNPVEEGVQTYICYWSETSRHDPWGDGGYDHQAPATGTSCELDPSGEMPALYFAAVVARNAMGLSSDYSTEVTVDLGNSSSEGASGGGGGGGGCFLSLLSGANEPR